MRERSDRRTNVEIEWPRHRVLELCPARWKETLEDELAQQRLAADPFRQITLGAFDAQLDDQA